MISSICCCVDAFAGAAFDRPLDVVVRHALRAGHLDHASQPGIVRRIAAAYPRRDTDFLRELAENRAALDVERTFAAFDLRPFAMSRHGMGLVIKVIARRASGVQKAKEDASMEKS